MMVTIPFSVAAQDVTDSIAEYYEHEETGLSLPCLIAFTVSIVAIECVLILVKHKHKSAM